MVTRNTSFYQHLYELIEITVYALVHLAEIVNTNFSLHLSLRQYRNVGCALTYRLETKLADQWETKLAYRWETKLALLYLLVIEPFSMHSLGNVFAAMALRGKIQ